MCKDLLEWLELCDILLLKFTKANTEKEHIAHEKLLR